MNADCVVVWFSKDHCDRADGPSMEPVEAIGPLTYDEAEVVMRAYAGRQPHRLRLVKP